MFTSLFQFLRAPTDEVVGPFTSSDWITSFSQSYVTKHLQQVPCFIRLAQSQPFK